MQLSSGEQSHVRVRMVGGPASGRTMLVPVPCPSVHRWVEYPKRVNRSIISPLAGPEREFLEYELRRRLDGSLVYFLRDLPDKDFDLEDLISRLRASWSGVELFSSSREVPVEMPPEFEQAVHRYLFHELHELARERNMMIIDFDGPTRESSPFATTVCVLRARCTQRPKA